MSASVLSKLTHVGMTGGPLPDFIPLQVENWRGIAGQRVYAECGLILPQGWLPGNQHLAVEDEQGGVTACQTNVLHAWPDDSAHSVLVIFPVVTVLDSPRQYRLIRSDTLPDGRCSIVSDSETITVDTAACVVEIDIVGPKQIRQFHRDGCALLGQQGLSVTPFNTEIEATGEWTFPVDNAEVTADIRENGLYRTVVHKTYIAAGRYRQEIDIYLYRDMPFVRIFAWGVRTGEPPAKLTREVALTAEIRRANNDPFAVSASRFCRKAGPFEQGVLSVPAASGTVHLILPWFREFGMDNPANLQAASNADVVDIRWCPVHYDTDPKVSPMDGPWQMDRYWREAAIWVDEVPRQSPAALAARQQMRFEGVIVEPAAAYSPESFILGSGLIKEEHFEQTLKFVQFHAEASFLKEDYPCSMAVNRDVHNWHSAYLYGHYWRHVPLDAPFSGTAPRAMKGEWGEWLLDVYRITRDPLLRKMVNLQARAIVTEYADGPFVDRDNQGVTGPRDDVGPTPYVPSGRYTDEQRRMIRYQSHLYAARDWPLLHLMWVKTGDPTYRDLARLVMENLHAHATSGDTPYEFRTDRDQHRIENLCKVAALFGDQRALDLAVAAAEPAAKRGKLPPWSQGGDIPPAIHGGPEGQNYVNIYTSLYMSTSYQLLFEMTGDPDHANVHRVLRNTTLDWIDAYDSDGQGIPSLTEPQPPSSQPSHFAGAAIQLMDLLIRDYLITKDPDDLARFHRLLNWVRKHALVDNPWGAGQAVLGGVHPYTLEPGWEDHRPNCRMQGGANLVALIDVFGPRWFWACAAYARAMFQPQYHAALRRLSITLPWKLPETTDSQTKRYGLRWPGGKLAYVGTWRRIHVMGGYDGGQLAIKILLPWYWSQAAFKLNARRVDMNIVTEPSVPLRYVCYETDKPFSLEIRRQT